MSWGGSEEKRRFQIDVLISLLIDYWTPKDDQSILLETSSLFRTTPTFPYCWYINTHNLFGVLEFEGPGYGMVKVLTVSQLKLKDSKSCRFLRVVQPVGLQRLQNQIV